MPTKRTRRARSTRQWITPQAVKHFRAGAWIELHRELKLKPWEWSPLDVTNTGPAPEFHNDEKHGWERAQEMRRELMEASK